MVTNTAESSILLAAATTLARDPGASLQEIATEAGVGRATIHRYFAKREDLLRELALSCIREIDELTAPIGELDLTASEALLKVLEVVVPLGNRYRVLGSEGSLINDPEASRGYQRHLEELSELVDQLKIEGAVAPDVPTTWVVSAIESLIYAAWSSAADGYIAEREAAQLVYRTVIAGLGVPQKE